MNSNTTSGGAVGSKGGGGVEGQQPTPSDENTTAPPPAAPRICDILLLSRSWSRHDLTPNPLLKYLHDGRNNPQGWLRTVEGEYDTYRTKKNGAPKGGRTKHLSEAENRKLIMVKCELDRLRALFPGEWPEGYTPHAHLAHAYDVSGRKVRACVEGYLRNNCGTKRKVRSDAGKPAKKRAGSPGASAITPSKPD